MNSVFGLGVVRKVLVPTVPVGFLGYSFAAAPRPAGAVPAARAVAAGGNCSCLENFEIWGKNY